MRDDTIAGVSFRQALNVIQLGGSLIGKNIILAVRIRS